MTVARLQGAADTDAAAEACGRRLLAVRMAFQMSQREFSDRLGIPQTTFNKWERGMRHPSAECLLAIYTEFGVSIPWLLQGPGDLPAFSNTKPDAIETAERLLDALLLTKRTPRPQHLAELMRIILDGPSATREERLREMVATLISGSTSG